MTFHERFNLALAHQLPDRLPMDLLWPRAETIATLKEHFQTDSAEEVFCKLGIDFRWIKMAARFPDFDKRVNGVLGENTPAPGTPCIFHDQQTFEDPWGIIQRVGDDGKYLQWRGGPLAEKEDLLGWALPSVVYPTEEEIAKSLARFADFITVIEIEFPFKIAWHLCGMEHFLTLMLERPEMVEQLYDRIYSFQTEKAVLAAKAGYDVIAVVGDIAGQYGMMFSPALFERFDALRFSGLIKQVRKANPQTKILYHSDGNIEAAIPSLIRCGIDILNPIQSACMDPAEIKSNFGRQLTFHGTISVQNTIPNGMVQDVRNEVITRIKTVGYNGGLVVSPENSIPYDAPLENILALYEAVKEFDYQSL